MTGKGSAPGDVVEKLSGQLTAVNFKIKQARERAVKADDPTVFLDLLEALGTERKTIITDLEAAKAKAASPAGDALGECASLIELLESAEGEERDELRRRTKAALARLVERIDVTILRKNNERFALIVAKFTAGGARLFLYWNGRTGTWCCNSYTGRGFAFDGAYPAQTIRGRDLFGKEFVEYVPAQGVEGTIHDPEFAVPNAMAARLRALIPGDGCATGTLKRTNV